MIIKEILLLIAKALTTFFLVILYASAMSIDFLIKIGEELWNKLDVEIRWIHEG